jgi:N-acyl-D-aspartate/D-glutamate deacylase
VQSISEIYARHVIEGVDITDIASLNTENGAMGLCMDMFLDHKVQENVLAGVSSCEKKERRRQAVMVKKAGSARISSGLVAGTECLV